MKGIEKKLSGGDLRSVGNVKSMVSEIRSRRDFDKIFTFLFHKDRLVVMRAADLIEKISVRKPYWLAPYKTRILALAAVAENKELKWHLAQLIPRLDLEPGELDYAWDLLDQWARDLKNSKIVRVFSLQGLFDLADSKPAYMRKFGSVLKALEKDDAPSIRARMRIIRKIFSLRHRENQP